MKIDFSKGTLQELACFVYETLKSHKIDVVLVGGACVSIYSEIAINLWMLISLLTKS